MKLTIAILFCCFSTLAAPPDAETEVLRLTKKLEQDQHKQNNPRYFQQLDKRVSNVQGLEYNVERYTHGRFGEGWVLNCYWSESGTNYVKRVNSGPATYVGHDWREQPLNPSP